MASTTDYPYVFDPAVVYSDGRDLQIHAMDACSWGETEGTSGSPIYSRGREQLFDETVQL